MQVQVLHRPWPPLPLQRQLPRLLHSSPVKVFFFSITFRLFVALKSKYVQRKYETKVLPHRVGIDDGFRQLHWWCDVLDRI